MVLVFHTISMNHECIRICNTFCFQKFTAISRIPSSIGEYQYRIDVLWWVQCICCIGFWQIICIGWILGNTEGGTSAPSIGPSAHDDNNNNSWHWIWDSGAQTSSETCADKPSSFMATGASPAGARSASSSDDGNRWSDGPILLFRVRFHSY